MVPRKSAAVFLIALLPLFAAYASIARSVNEKFALIESDRVPPGGRVSLTSTELTSYAREQADLIAPNAVHDARLAISSEGAEATARIDFLHLRSIAGGEPNWLLRSLLQGDRPVRVLVKVQSGNGRARVDVQRVEVSGVVVEGRALDFLMREFVVPSFPDARVGAWFELGHNIDRFDLKPGAVDVCITRRR